MTYKHRPHTWDSYTEQFVKTPRHGDNVGITATVLVTIAMIYAAITLTHLFNFVTAYAALS